ncbi:MAG TPA: chloride channel protein, partial [Chitinophagaceae bacterium]|nr:chloride channel protein [Chitinophagaceae bacterium]
VVYLIEDSFEKIPIHWMWWPALGGLVVGIVGYFSPHTLGVGYDNITNILSGKMTISFLLGLCLLKFTSWSIALGSGTSGGTLAPLFIIGGAAGALAGHSIHHFFPALGISLPLCALVGMAAMFTGASRAFLTSMIFAIETTNQSEALLPLLGACGGSYIVSFFLMKNTIMTEKISRRGIKTPDSYEPDILEKIPVKEVMQNCDIIIHEDNSLEQVLEGIDKNGSHEYFIVADGHGNYKGLLKYAELFSKIHNSDTQVSSIIIQNNVSVYDNNSLRVAVEKMAAENAEALPVLSQNNKITGILSLKNIMTAYRQSISDYEKSNPVISLKRRGLKVIVKGQKILDSWKIKSGQSG